MSNYTKAQLISALQGAGHTPPRKATLAVLAELVNNTPAAELLPPLEATPVGQAPVEAPVAPTPAVAPATPAPAGLKIEKDRPEQNGVKRPSTGGKCRAIWDALDAYLEETGDQPTSKTVKELAADSGWNPNNASIEYYQWRKYNGVAKA